MFSDGDADRQAQAVTSNRDRISRSSGDRTNVEGIGERVAARIRDRGDGCVIRSRAGERELQAAVHTVSVIVGGELGDPVARVERDKRVGEHAEARRVEVDSGSRLGRERPVIHISRRIVIGGADLSRARVPDGDRSRRGGSPVRLSLRSHGPARDRPDRDGVGGTGASAVAERTDHEVVAAALANPKGDAAVETVEIVVEGDQGYPVGREQRDGRIQQRPGNLCVYVEAEELPGDEIDGPDIPVTRRIDHANDPVAECRGVRGLHGVVGLEFLNERLRPREGRQSGQPHEQEQDEARRVAHARDDRHRRARSLERFARDGLKYPAVSSTPGPS